MPELLRTIHARRGSATGRALSSVARYCIRCRQYPTQRVHPPSRARCSSGKRRCSTALRKHDPGASDRDRAAARNGHRPPRRRRRELREPPPRRGAGRDPHRGPDGVREEVQHRLSHVLRQRRQRHADARPLRVGSHRPIPGRRRRPWLDRARPTRTSGRAPRSSVATRSGCSDAAVVLLERVGGEIEEQRRRRRARLESPAAATRRPT